MGGIGMLPGIPAPAGMPGIGGIVPPPGTPAPAALSGRGGSVGKPGGGVSAGPAPRAAGAGWFAALGNPGGNDPGDGDALAKSIRTKEELCG